MRRVLLGVLVAACLAQAPPAVAADGPGGLYAEILPAPQPDAPVMLFFHGGGWLITGKDVVLGSLTTPRLFQRMGWTVWAVEYRGGRPSREDSHAWLDAVRRAAPESPVCVSGESAGSQLALMLAAERPTDVRCAVGFGAITWLDHFGNAFDDSLANLLWAPDYDANSPIEQAFPAGSGLLLASSAADELTTCEAQLTPFATRHPQAVTRCLAAGTPEEDQVGFIHAPVDATAMELVMADACRTLSAASAATRCLPAGWAGARPAPTPTPDAEPVPSAEPTPTPTPTPATAPTPSPFRVTAKRVRAARPGGDHVRIVVSDAAPLDALEVCVTERGARWRLTRRAKRVRRTRICWRRDHAAAPAVFRAYDGRRHAAATITVRVGSVVRDVSRVPAGF